MVDSVPEVQVEIDIQPRARAVAAELGGQRRQLFLPFWSVSAIRSGAAPTSKP